MSTKIYVTLAVLVSAFLAFTATAFAAGVATPADGSLLDLARPVFDAIMHGQWWLGASLALVLIVAAFRRYAPGKAGAFAHSAVGAALLVLVGSFGGALATGIMAAGTSALTMALVWVSLKVAFGAAGGYSLLKPLIVWVAAKAPAWMQPAFAMITWMFDGPTAIQTAETAGNAAVEAKPAAGADGTLGAPEEL